MNAYPLETPLSQLPDYQRVFIVRHGLVYLYPAQIVRDIANDRYTVDPMRPWTATPADWDAGEKLSNRLCDERNRWEHGRLRELTRVLWITERGASSGFAIWWESVAPESDPCVIGAAARVAARELMTFPLFKHRHLVDDLHTLT